MSSKDLVERFYFVVWNRADEDAAREILHPEFKFRGSLGPECQGVEAFLAYMRSIHGALGQYTCIVDDLIVSENRAAARMTFKGIHRRRFFDVEPTGHEVSWAGAAFFTTDGERIVDLWVLGDVEGLKQRLGAHGPAEYRD